ncbi:50S ribosome-binding GTPase [Candidatus Woesearchaeota archaeon]|jgi:ferrous iron transport protein B|nr:50S ribosome-binding GTPase [Candidatus Woesearchaeota archaeon]
MNNNKQEYIVAVAGQPNSGKSTVFNMLTGARQFVANYPGVTVEKKIGFYSDQGQKIKLVDLPGTYSLTSYSLEERIARNFIIEDNPDLVLNIVDASNLDRHLNLTFQLLEMNVPIIVVLNMIDVSKGRGFEIDINKLSEELGTTVVPTIAQKGKGKEELRQIILNACINKVKYKNSFRVDYGENLEPVLKKLEQKISTDARFLKYNPRWLAVKFIAGDAEANNLLEQ